MKKVIIEIETVNDAFGDDPNDEIARILQHLASSFYAHGAENMFSEILDINGHKVGSITIE